MIRYKDVRLGSRDPTYLPVRRFRVYDYIGASLTLVVQVLKV